MARLKRNNKWAPILYNNFHGNHYIAVETPANYTGLICGYSYIGCNSSRGAVCKCKKNVVVLDGTLVATEAVCVHDHLHLLVNDN